MNVYKSDFTSDFPPAKRHKKNPLGEDVYLLPDGSVKRDEDAIIAAQRIWKHEAYKPEGIMYMKGLERFTSRDKSGEQCSPSNGDH
jgi:hypothetical protein